METDNLSKRQLPQPPLFFELHLSYLVPCAPIMHGVHDRSLEVHSQYRQSDLIESRRAYVQPQELLALKGYRDLSKRPVRNYLPSLIYPIVTVRIQELGLVRPPPPPNRPPK